MAEAPKYFIQIPVLTAKQSDISSTDKLVFGEIYTMLNTEDRCWLTNTGIGNRINKNKATVRNSVKKLKKLGYIKTNVIPNGHEYSKRFTYGYNLGGTKLGTTKFGSTKESTSVVPNKVQQSHQIKYPSKSNSKSNSKSVTNNGKLTYRQMIVKDLESLMVNINTFVSQDIDDWLNNYSPKLIMKAIHQVGSTSPSPAWVTKDISTQLSRGCKTYQPKPKHRFNNYQRPNNSEQAKWSANKAKQMEQPQKFHPTSKKQNEKVQRMLKELNNREKH